MGIKFSKSSSKVAPLPAPIEPRNCSSAPASLGPLEGTSPYSQLEARMSDPGAIDVAAESNPAASPSASPSPSAEPAARGPKKIDVIGEQSDGKMLAADMPAVAADVPDEAKQWAQVFGDSIIRYYHSADWKEREMSLASIQRSLGSSKFMAEKDPKAVFTAATEMLTISLKDKVAPIFHASLQLVSALLASLCPLLTEQTLRQGMATLMTIMVHRCGNLNTRIHEASLQTLLAVAKVPCFTASYVAPFAIAEMPKRSRVASHAAQMYGRLDLMYSLLSSYRSMSKLPVDDVLQFCKQGLDMPDEKVRQAAIKVIVELHQLHKASGKVLQLEYQLGSLKPALMQMLLKRCEEADAEGGEAEPMSSLSGRKLPALGVCGKSLPRLPSPQSSLPTPTGPSFQRPPTSSGAYSPADPSSPSTTAASPSKANRGRSRLACSDNLGSSTVNLRLSTAPKSKTTTASNQQAPTGVISGLDDTEEQLIQYMMADQKLA